MSDAPSTSASPAISHVRGGAAVYLPGDTFGPRTLPDFEFVWITSGSATYTQDNRSHAAKAGCIILARPGFVETYRWDATQTSRHLFFHFALHHAPSDWPDMATWPVVTSMPAGDALRPMFRTVLDVWCRHHLSRVQPPPPWIGRTIIAMIDALLAQSGAASQTPNEGGHPAVQRAVDWLTATLRKQPDAPVSLANLAEAAKVNPSHLTRLFRRSDRGGVGASPMRVVQLMRLEQAMTLLERSNLTIQEIAHRTGFASQFHFSRVFRATYGQPPTALRDAIYQGQPRPASPLRLDAPPIEI
jgi:AraC family transcriptional regulator